MAATRRLAAIVAADVAGYSRLMGTDEEGTLQRLKAHHRQLIDPKIALHHGRIVKTTGDGLLVEFPSVVDAMRCAAEVQRGMLDREPELPDEKQIRFRMGINLGDVIAEGGDIFGEGVNIAARLEALAEPGGICVSGTVRDQIHKLPYPFEDLGERNVKNIARPVRVYALGASAVAALPAVDVAVRPRSARRRVGLRRDTPRLSIVVLPFANLSSDPDQQYFADGITDDVTTDLSRIANSFVISRNTAFTYRNKPVDTKRVGRELGVRYVLEGSVRRSGDKVRVNAQLIDAETDAHLWAEQFDSDVTDLFTLQNEITSRIAIALNVELSGREAARPTKNPDALDYILRGRAAHWRGNSRNQVQQKLSLYEQALALDPHSVEALSMVAEMLSVRAGMGWSETPAADFRRAEQLVAAALASAPRDYFAHNAKGAVLRFQGRCDEAIPEYETAIALNPNWVGALDFLAWCKLVTGAIEEVVPLEERAIRLSPRDPYIQAFFYGRIGLAYLLQSRTGDAVLWLERARSAAPANPLRRAELAAAYGHKGESDRAAAELAEARRLEPDGRYSSLARVKAAGTLGGPGYWGVAEVRALFEATYFAGLRKAGMPEE